MPSDTATAETIVHSPEVIASMSTNVLAPAATSVFVRDASAAPQAPMRRHHPAEAMTGHPGGVFAAQALAL